MIRQLIFVLTILVLVNIYGPVRAESNDHAVLQDNRGGNVFNTTGNCVRTMWKEAGDPCAPQEAPPPVAAPKPVAVVAPPPPPQPVKHTIISEAARTVYFPFNKAALTDQTKAQLDTLAQTLKAAKDIKEAKIVGAADRIGGKTYNDKLSQKRAEAVRDYLIARGYTNANITHTKWVGKSEPVTQCSQKLKHKKLVACLQNDRRVQLDIVYRAEVTIQPTETSATGVATPSPVPSAAPPVMIKPVR